MVFDNDLKKNDDSFHERLDSLKNKIKSNVGKNSLSDSYGIKIVADVIAGLVVGGILGYITDRLFGTSPIFFILLMICGFFVGFYIFYKDLTIGKKSRKKN